MQPKPGQGRVNEMWLLPSQSSAQCRDRRRTGSGRLREVLGWGRDSEPRLPLGRRGFSVQMSSEVRKGGEGSLSRGHSSSDTRRGAWHGLYRTSVSLSLTGSQTLTIPAVSPPPLPLPSCGRGGNSVILPFLGAELKVQTALPFLPVDSWRYSEPRTPG